MFDHFVYLPDYTFLGPFLSLAVAQFVAANYLGAEIISVEIETLEG